MEVTDTAETNNVTAQPHSLHRCQSTIASHGGYRMTGEAELRQGTDSLDKGIGFTDCIHPTVR